MSDLTDIRYSRENSHRRLAVVLRDPLLADMPALRADFQRELAAGSQGLIVDMGSVISFDQAAMLELMEVVRQLRHDGLRLSFFGLSGQAKKMIRVFGARDLFSVAKDEAEAAQLLGAKPQARPATSMERHQAARAVAAETDVKKREVRIELPADAGLVTAMRPFIHTALRENNFSEKFADDVELVFDEAVHNIIEHSYGGDLSKRLRIRLELEDDGVTIELSDDGETYDPTARPDIDMKEYLKEKRMGGLGVHLIRTLMDTVEHTSGPSGKGNILTMVKKIK